MVCNRYGLLSCWINSIHYPLLLNCTIQRSSLVSRPPLSFSASAETPANKCAAVKRVTFKSTHSNWSTVTPNNRLGQTSDLNRGPGKDSEKKQGLWWSLFVCLCLCTGQSEVWSGDTVPARPLILDSCFLCHCPVPRQKNHVTPVSHVSRLCLPAIMWTFWLL